MEKKPVVLVSRCLLGDACRYDGASKPHAGVLQMHRHYMVIPICPESDGGLPTPRPPAERMGERVVNCHGTDVTDAYQRGAEHALALARQYGAIGAVLKLKSPACGTGKIYDGTFTGTLTAGDGVTAALLKHNQIPVWGENMVGEDGYIAVHPMREGEDTAT